jgi:hypothetical protein
VTRFNFGIAAWAVTLFAATGCTPDQWVEFDVLTDVMPNTVLEADRIVVARGFAVGAEALPIENNARRDEVVIDLVPDADGIIGIDHGLEKNTFVIYGINAGSTTVDVYFDDNLIGDMTAKVVAQD